MENATGFYHGKLSSTGQVIYEQTFTFPGLISTSLENVLVTQTGDLVLPGTGTTGPSPIPNALVLLRVSPEGDSLHSAQYQVSSGVSITRHAIERGDGILVSMQGGPAFELGGGTKYVLLDDDFNATGGFLAPNVGGQPEDYHPDSLFRIPMDMVAVGGSAIMVSGEIGLNSLGKRAGVMVIDDQGTLLRQFLPQSAYLHDHPPLLSGLAQKDDNGYYFAMVENFHAGMLPYEPIEPSRARVFLLDSLLQAHCTFVLDGSEDNVYYSLDRIRAASDGGFILMGSRKLIGSGQRFQAWAQKFPPEACQPVGVDEHAPLSAHLFPNPGTEGFAATLNGPVVQGGTLRLFEAQGRLVGSVPVQQSSARFNAQGLVPGMYFYHISDAQGRSRGSGKWVKE
ncbi:MAG: T9SS type A sorting domain-containing protein [Flavobacteriales bacterium]|nr:T9SS type A sorting domain-containing protein [Flavobacteriales bacterium]